MTHLRLEHHLLMCSLSEWHLVDKVLRVELLTYVDLSESFKVTIVGKILLFLFCISGGQFNLSQTLEGCVIPNGHVTVLLN